MIKLFSKFIAGFIGGLILATVIAYGFGYAMEAMQIQLYDSEADQQRNYNIFIVFAITVAFICGYLFTRTGKKD